MPDIYEICMRQYLYLPPSSEEALSVVGTMLKVIGLLLLHGVFGADINIRKISLFLNTYFVLIDTFLGLTSLGKRGEEWFGKRDH